MNSTTLTMPFGWVSFTIGKYSGVMSSAAPEMKVYYNYQDKVFTLAPVLTSLDFLSMLVSPPT